MAENNWTPPSDAVEENTEWTPPSDAILSEDVKKKESTTSTGGEEFGNGSLPPGIAAPTTSKQEDYGFPGAKPSYKVTEKTTEYVPKNDSASGIIQATPEELANALSAANLGTQDDTRVAKMQESIKKIGSELQPIESQYTKQGLLNSMLSKPELFDTNTDDIKLNRRNQEMLDNWLKQIASRLPKDQASEIYDYGAKLNKHKNDLIDFSTRLNQNPDDNDAAYGLGNIELDLGNNQAALNAYTLALKGSNYSDPRAYNGLGYIFLQNGDTESAKEYYEKAVELKPDDAIALNALGTIAAKSKDNDKAKEYFDQALALDPYNNTATYNKYKLSVQSGDKEEAKKDLEKYQLARALTTEPMSIGAPGTEEYKQAQKAKQIADMYDTFLTGGVMAEDPTTRRIFRLLNPLGAAVTTAEKGVFEGAEEVSKGAKLIADNMTGSTFSPDKAKGELSGLVKVAGGLAHGFFGLSMGTTLHGALFDFGATMAPEQLGKAVMAPATTAFDIIVQGDKGELTSDVLGLVDIPASMLMMHGIMFGKDKLVDIGKKLLKKEKITKEEADIAKDALANEEVTIKDAQAARAVTGDLPAGTTIEEQGSIIADKIENATEEEIKEAQKKADEDETALPKTAFEEPKTEVKAEEVTAPGVEVKAEEADIEAKKDDIERRRQEEIRKLPEGTVSSLKRFLDTVNAKYDAELAALEKAKAEEIATPKTAAVEKQPSVKPEELKVNVAATGPRGFGDVSAEDASIKDIDEGAFMRLTNTSNSDPAKANGFNVRDGVLRVRVGGAKELISGRTGGATHVSLKVPEGFDPKLFAEKLAGISHEGGRTTETAVQKVVEDIKNAVSESSLMEKEIATPKAKEEPMPQPAAPEPAVVKTELEKDLEELRTELGIEPAGGAKPAAEAPAMEAAKPTEVEETAQPKTEPKKPIIKTLFRGEKEKSKGKWWTGSKKQAEAFSKGRSGKEGVVKSEKVDISNAKETNLILTNTSSLSELSKELGLSEQEIMSAFDETPFTQKMIKAGATKAHEILENKNIQKLLQDKGYDSIGAKEFYGANTTSKSYLRFGKPTEETAPPKETAPAKPETAKPEPVVEPTPTEPKEGDMVEIPSAFSGGMPRQMVYKDGTWVQKIGRDFTEVGKSVKDEAQAKFDENAKLPTEADVVKTPILRRLNRAFLNIGSVIFDNAKQLKEKAEELAKGKGKVEYSITMPDGSKKTVVNVNPDVVNGFYSPLEKAIGGAKQEKMPAKQWIEKFANSEEAKWTGLKDWLSKQQGSVSKQDIQNYLKNNKIQISEVVKQDKESKYEKYQEPGAKQDYKEVLITLPSKKIEGEPYHIVRDKYLKPALKEIGLDNSENALRRMKIYEEEGRSEEFKNDPDYKIAQEALKKLKENGYQNVLDKYYSGFEYSSEVEKQRKSEFKSTHYEEPNILVHLRMNTRTDANGNKVLFLEEVQSDWGQKGKKEGFKKQFVDQELKNWLNSDREENDVFDKLIDKYSIDTGSGEGLESQLEEKLQEQETGISAAPFVMDTNDWTKLGLKVALKEAVKQGADKIAWTTGEQQNERYNLSNVIENITVTNDGLHKEGYTIYKVKSEYKSGEETFGYYKAEELSNVLGKDLADKILADNIQKGEKETYEGVDLKVGGKGMKGFYGSTQEGSKGIIGGVAEKLFKQKVGETEINNNKQFSVDITPELKAEVEQGLPLFHYNKNGEIIGFTHDGKIYLNGEKITAKTTMEEAGHIWTNWAKDNRPDLHKSGLEKVTGSAYLKNVENSPFYQKEALKQGEKGSQAYNDYMKEEALAKAISDEGAKFVTEAKKADFKKWVTDMWKSVAKHFGIKNISAEEISKMSLEDFAKKAAADVFARGEKGEAKGTEGDMRFAAEQKLDAEQESKLKAFVDRKIAEGKDLPYVRRMLEEFGLGEEKVNEIMGGAKPTEKVAEVKAEEIAPQEITPQKETIDKFSELTNFDKELESASTPAKRKQIEDRRQQWLNDNPSIKEIDANAKEIIKQLEAKELITKKKGPCF